MTNQGATMNIPEEACKAAERALREADLDRFGPEKTYASLARAALTAAAPMLMAQAWDEALNAYREDVSRGDVWRRNPYRKEQS